MVTIYTSESCPKCKILKEKLNLKGIKYKEIQDLEQLVEKGFNFVPVLEVDNIMMEFSQANKWVNEQE